MAPSPWRGPLRGGAGSLPPGDGEWSQNLDVAASSDLLVSLKRGAQEGLPAKHRAQWVQANETVRNGRSGWGGGGGNAPRKDCRYSGQLILHVNVGFGY